jgi:DNA-binding IclR family transcriptional regulator
MLIQKRPKRFLKSADIVKIIGWSKSKTFALLKQMKQLEIIEKADEGYRISEKYIRKGAGKNAGKNQK